MPAWGVGPFENDVAVDWAQECAQQADVAFVAATLDQVLVAAEEDLDADDAEEGIAAAEAVARMLGNRGTQDSFSKPVDDWIGCGHPPVTPELAAKARQALARILTDPSELLELWDASDNFPEWRSGMEALLSRCQEAK